MTEVVIGTSYSEKGQIYKEAFSNIRFYGSIFILFSTVGFSYLYMSGFSARRSSLDEAKDKETEGGSHDILRVIGLLRSINSSIEKGKLESVLSEKERIEIINKISQTVDSQLNDTLLSKIEKKYGSTIINSKLSNQSSELLLKTVSRLKDNAEALQSKATINLLYGIGSTIGAISILVYLLMNSSPPTEVSKISIIFYYSSRFFLVLMVEGVAIFFLKLYKVTLTDIMYINNEITNYEAKRDALALSFMSGDEESTSEMLQSLANTERNFIIKKGETSIFDRESRSKENQNRAIADLLSKLAKQDK